MLCRFLFWTCVLKVAVSLPTGVYIGKDGSVGASWGGYSASAGLGGLVGGSGTRGGLHAQAGTPDGHFAAAGLGGSVSEAAGTQGQLYSVAGQAKPVIVGAPVIQPVATAPVGAGGASAQASASSTASASSGGGAQGGIAPVVLNKRPGSFFDDIFNIPISTLGAVNQYLNNRNKVRVVPSGVVRVQQVQPVQSSQSNAFSSSSASASASSSSSANSASHAGTSDGIDNSIYYGYQKNPNYNDIFNIPISVLGAVNKFLNGK